MKNEKFGSLYYVFLFLCTLVLAAGPLQAVEITMDFEGPNPLGGFVIDEWGVRTVDSCQWGPQTTTSGTHAIGVPEVCQQGYPNGNPSQLWEGSLATPKIALDAFTNFYFGFNYWADFEGVTDTFDGVILELINVTQGTTVQIDSLVENDICPTYDAIIGTTNPRLRGLWAWCFDTLAPTFNSLGYPYLVLQSKKLGEEVSGRPDKHPNMPTDFEWRSLVSVDMIAAGYAAQGDTVRIRWVFASDQLANGAGYFFDDLFITSEAPDDNQPPTIEVTSPGIWANIADSSSDITVTADLSEGCGGSGVNPDSVYVIYDIEDTGEVLAAMTNTAGDTYEGTVPAQTYDTDIRYRVRATDLVGNTGSSPWRHMEVTDAITLSWDDGIPASVFPDLQAGDGFAVRFTAPTDSLYLLHKIMYYFAREDGQFHVVVNNDAGGFPGATMFQDQDLTNGAVANTFFQYEFADADSVWIQPNQSFHVGMRLASSDTTLDPQQLSDGTGEYDGESWVLDQGAGGWGEVWDGETLIRCKVKKHEIPDGFGDNEDGRMVLPRVYSLGQNYPNPFNPSTTIRFAIPAQESDKASVETQLGIYNIRGQLVKTLISEDKSPGEYAVQWDGKNEKGEMTASGIYLYRLQAGDFISIRKMVILK
jgi:hypothetical protein